MGRRSAEAEYREESRRLQLPEGVEWGPADLPVEPGTPVRYERGLGTYQADFRFICVWQQAFLEASRDSSERRTAIGALRRVRRLPAYRLSLNNEGRARLDDVVEQALQGSIEPLAADVEANC